MLNNLEVEDPNTTVGRILILFMKGTVMCSCAGDCILLTPTQIFGKDLAGLGSASTATFGMEFLKSSFSCHYATFIGTIENQIYLGVSQDDGQEDDYRATLRMQV